MRPRPMDVFACLVIVSTALVHAAFFGAGRYGLVVVPFVTLLCVNVRSQEELEP